MNKKIILENCNINQFKICTYTPLTIESKYMNSIGEINILTSGDNLEDSMVEMAGDFSDCKVKIKSNCTFLAAESFNITEPIHIETPEFCKISVLGNFENTRGITILSSIDLYTYQEIYPKNLEIRAYIKGQNHTLHMLGNFQESNLTVISPLTLKLGAQINELIVSDSCSELNLNTLSDGYINNVKNFSTIKLSGNTSAVREIISNTSTGAENIILTSLSYILDFINGSADLITTYTTPGEYAITLKLLQGDEPVQLLQTIYITVK